MRRKLVSCEVLGTGRYNRKIAKCHAGKGDIAEYMVWTGYALAYRKYSQMYANAENDARRNRRGMWQGQFTKPWNYRKR